MRRAGVWRRAGCGPAGARGPVGGCGLRARWPGGRAAGAPARGGRWAGAGTLARGAGCGCVGPAGGCGRAGRTAGARGGLRTRRHRYRNGPRARQAARARRAGCGCGRPRRIVVFASAPAPNRPGQMHIRHLLGHRPGRTRDKSQAQVKSLHNSAVVNRDGYFERPADDAPALRTEPCELLLPSIGAPPCNRIPGTQGG